jgi:hypothetical protein
MVEELPTVSLRERVSLLATELDRSMQGWQDLLDL